MATKSETATMSSDDSRPLIDALNKRINELTTENADLRAEAKKRRLEAKGLKEEMERIIGERDELAEGIHALDEEYTDYKAQSEAHPSELQAKIDELTTQIRTRAHRDEFNKLAKEANVLEDALDDLWQLLGYKAESDAPDSAQMGERIGEAIKARPYFTQGETPTTGRDVPKPAPKPALTVANGASRGDRDTNPHAFRVSSAQLADSQWMLVHEKQFHAAREAGTLEFTD